MSYDWFWVCYQRGWWEPFGFECDDLVNEDVVLSTLHMDGHRIFLDHTPAWTPNKVVTRETRGVQDL